MTENQSKSGNPLNESSAANDQANLEQKQSYFLDLRGVACPMNFVKTRLKLDKMVKGETLEVWLDDGEPFESVSSSVLSEGHLIESSARVESYHSLRIRKAD